MSATVTAIILTARRLPLLEKCLASLARQKQLPDRIIVVCTDAEDGSAEWLAAHTGHGLSIHVLSSGAGGSFAEARNAGIRAATTEWIAFLDDDCEADAHWLERLLATATIDRLDAVGGMVLPADELEAPDGYHPDLCWAAGLLPESFLGPLGGRRVLPSTSNLMGRASLFREFPFQEVGGEAGDYFAGREDSQWWRSIRRAGRLTGIARRALVWHHVPQERLDPEVLQARLEADGAAHWRREHNAAEAPAAARDILAAPIGAVNDWLRGGTPLREAWTNRAAWAARQRSFLAASVDDYSPRSLNPAGRLETFVLQGANLLCDGAKAAARHMVSLGLDAWRASARAAVLDFSPMRPLVVLHDNLGDAVLAIPMIRQLHNSLQAGNVTVLCGNLCYGLLTANVPEGTKVLRVPKDARGRNLSATRALHRLVRDLDPDVQIIAYAHGLNPAPFFAHSAPLIAWTRDNGLERALWRDSIDFPVEKSWEKHEVAALLDLLAPLGVATIVERPEVAIPPAAKQRAGELIRRHSPGARGYVVLQVETQPRYKDWPVENFLQVADQLSHEGYRVFLTGSPSGRGTMEQACAERPGCIALHGQISITDLAALLAGAACFVGVDSGPGHLAQAVGCPSVLIFGRTTIHRWKPLISLRGEKKSAPPVEIVQGPGCDWLEEELCGLPLNTGMEMIRVEEVVARCRSLLN